MGMKFRVGDLVQFEIYSPFASEYPCLMVTSANEFGPYVARVAQCCPANCFHTYIPVYAKEIVLVSRKDPEDPQP